MRRRMSWLSDGWRRYTWLLLVCCFCSTMLSGLSEATGSASAAPLSPDSFGVNVSFAMINGKLGPSDLATGSTAGLGLARTQVLKGQNVDAQVALAAAAHTR